MKALEGLKAMAIKPAAPAMDAMEPDEEDEGGEDDSPLMGAATDLIAAVKAGDAAGVAEALRTAYEACANEDGEE